MSDGQVLAGKVALVTGSSRRMGREIALRLAEAGADVVINGVSDLDRANAVAREVASKGVRSTAILADIRRPDDVRRIADETITTFGRLDILVNNAAIRRHTPLAEISLQEWHEGLSTVLDGTFLLAQAFAPHLTASRGTIVNIGGASAHYVVKNHATVMTAKMGLVGLTRALAADLAPHVVVNCLIPGKAAAAGEQRDRNSYPIERVLSGRAGTLEEIAEGVFMLCNPKCRFINGQAIHISGGMLFGL